MLLSCREVVVATEFDNVRYRLDCHSCLLVEIGERANYLGLPCETCGRKPRSILLHTRNRSVWPLSTIVTARDEKIKLASPQTLCLFQVPIRILLRPLFLYIPTMSTSHPSCYKITIIF